MNYDDYYSVKRISAAQKIKDSAVLSEDLTPGQESAVIQGSAADPYQVTLESCTCPDFHRTGAPCKHMYKLMLDAGLLTLPVLKKKKDRTFDPVAEIKRYRDLYTAGEIDGDVYTKVCSVLEKTK